MLPSSWEVPNLKCHLFLPPRAGGCPKNHNGSEDAVGAEAGLLVWNMTEAFYK